MVNSQELAILIKREAKLQKIPIGKMLSSCGLSVNTLSSMQSGGYFPRLEAIVKIADFLNCSLDYLLGRTDTVLISTEQVSLDDISVPGITLNQNETQLVLAYRQADDDDRAIVSHALKKYMEPKQEKTVSAG